MRAAITTTCLVVLPFLVFGCGRVTETTVLKQPSTSTIGLVHAGTYRMYTKGRQGAVRAIPYPPNKAKVFAIQKNRNKTAIPTKIVKMSFAVGSQEGDCDVLVFDVNQPGEYEIDLADVGKNLRPVHLEKFK